MGNDESLARAKHIMIRVVSEKIPIPKRWRVSKEFKSWIEGLSEEEFKTYLNRLRTLTQTLSDEEMPKEKGVFISGRSYRGDQLEVKGQLDAIGGEATAYYALALWRNIQVENLLKELNEGKSNWRG